MIYLCRHGETAWNREGRLQGRLESPLTERGLRQADAMAGLLRDIVRRDPQRPWRLVSSPARRTVATAQAIAQATGLAIETDERLLEISCGAWEGRLRGDLLRDRPDLQANPEWLFNCPGGESFEAVVGRVAAWLADQPPEPDRAVIAVSHGVAGRMLRAVYAGIPRADVPGLPVPQDAVFQLSGGLVGRMDCEPVD